MATVTKDRTEVDPRHDRIASFDVVCVVGTVRLDQDGTIPPHVAAMQMIAEHDAEGCYSFPMPDGRTQRVTVEFVPAQAQ